MYNRISRDESYIAELTSFIELMYGLRAQSLTPAKRGFYGETWKLIATEGIFFVKIDFSTPHKATYQRSLPVIEHLQSHGITHISRIIKTKEGELSTWFVEGVLVLFAFVPGENTEDYQLARLFKALIPIYKISSEGVSIEKEDFNTDCLAIVADELQRLRQSNRAPERDLAEFLDSKDDLLQQRATHLKIFAAKCLANQDDFVITHGDAGGNAILEGERFTIIDWDHPKLAPIERDAWFFMHHTDSLNIINKLLREQGIEYSLQPERLAFYAYYSFFYYLHEYLTCLFAVENEQTIADLVQSVKDYFFNGWIESRMQAAEAIKF